MKVQLVCQFGKPVRGLSPYGDPLLAALRATGRAQFEAVDFSAAYPGLLHPASQGGARTNGDLHWGNPASWKRVASRGADILHLQHWSAPLSAYLWPLASMARRRGAKIVVTVHNPKAHEMIGGVAWLESRLLGAAHALVVHDQRGAEVLRARLGAEAPIHVIPHGIGMKTIQGHPAESDYRLLGLEPNRRYVVLFGNLRGYKGVPLLVGAWDIAAAGIPDADLIVAGRLWDGRGGVAARLAGVMLGGTSEKKRIEYALSNARFRERIHLREGFLEEGVIEALLRVSSLAVFPYERFSSQSGAACRAAGAGCPVLVSDVGGLPNLVIDSSWVVAPGSVKDLARALGEKLNDLARCQRRLQISQLERASGSTWEQVAKAHIDLYGSVVLEGHSRKH